MPHYKLDGGPLNPEEFSRQDILQIKELLAQLEEHGPIDNNTFQVLKRVITTFEKHSAEIEAVIKREQTNALLSELKARWWSTAKWALGGIVFLLGVFPNIDDAYTVIKRWLGFP